MQSERNYWLMKSEPNVYSIDHLEKDGSTYWDGVRNFKARNHMMEMKEGDGVFFYHSNADPKAIVGLARVSKEAYPDFTQFDKKSKYYERRATKEKPYWYMVDIEFVAKLDEAVTLEELRKTSKLEGMSLLKKGQRLSVQRVALKEWQTILMIAGATFKP
jgi:predicted RNA-binding protein with PUA-like domain